MQIKILRFDIKNNVYWTAKMNGQCKKGNIK